MSDLNYTAVAFDTPFNRDVVEECVRNVILEFSRALSGKLRYDIWIRYENIDGSNHIIT